MLGRRRGWGGRARSSPGCGLDGESRFYGSRVPSAAARAARRRGDGPAGAAARYHRPVPQTVPVVSPGDPHLPATPRRPSGRTPASAPAHRATSPPPVLVEVHRGEHRRESAPRPRRAGRRHGGRVIRAAGTPDVAVTLRSTVKPFALVALIESGAADDLGLTPAELAVMGASHTGEDKHVRTLQGVFRRASVSQALLRCGTEGAPADARDRRPARPRRREPPARSGTTAPGSTPPACCCSAYADWSLDDYADPAHRSQVAVRETVARLFGRRPAALRTSPDNCGLLTYEFAARRRGACLSAPRRPGRAATAMPRGARVRAGPAAHPRRDDGRPGHGRRHLREPRHRAHAPPPRPPRRQGRCGGAARRRPAAGVRETAGGRRRRGHQDRGRRPLARAIKAATVEALAQLRRVGRARPPRAGCLPISPSARTPDGRRRRLSPPVFELAPLGELA